MSFLLFLSFRQRLLLAFFRYSTGRIIFIVTHDYEFFCSTCTRCVSVLDLRIVRCMPETERRKDFVNSFEQFIVKIFSDFAGFIEDHGRFLLRGNRRPCRECSRRGSTGFGEADETVAHRALEFPRALELTVFGKRCVAKEERNVRAVPGGFAHLGEVDGELVKVCTGALPCSMHGSDLLRGLAHAPVDQDDIGIIFLRESLPEEIDDFPGAVTVYRTDDLLFLLIVVLSATVPALPSRLILPSLASHADSAEAAARVQAAIAKNLFIIKITPKKYL